MRPHLCLSLVISGLLRGTVSSKDSISLDSSTNIWLEYTLHANSIYRSKVEEVAELFKDKELKRKALRVADVGTFIWIDSVESVTDLGLALEDVPPGEILGVVVRNLPREHCSALPVDRPPKNITADISEAYQYDFIEVIADIIESNGDKAFALILEPFTLPEVSVNMDLQSCTQKREVYLENMAYALKKLNKSNVVIYIDAGEESLGWADSRTPVADIISQVYEAAERPSQLRGFATNVASWNSWDLSPGEFARADDSAWNPAQNEKEYVSLLGEDLRNRSVPHHAIVDTSRSAVQGLRKSFDSWCNINGAGFGMRYSVETGSELTDAFVWVKQGGDSDGTSDTGSERYEAGCGLEDAFKPSPEVGEWNQAYFQMLVENAKPSF